MGELTNVKLRDAAKTHGITLHVRCKSYGLTISAYLILRPDSVVGRVDQTIFHDTDIIKTFLQINSKDESLPYVVEFQSYDKIDTRVPSDTLKAFTILDKIVDIFPMTLSTLFYNSVLPRANIQKESKRRAQSSLPIVQSNTCLLLTSSRLQASSCILIASSLLGSNIIVQVIVFHQNSRTHLQAKRWHSFARLRCPISSSSASQSAT